MDNHWKVHRGRSIVVEGYKDEIASKKGKAAATLVHRSKWLPYGEREGEDSKKAAYACKLVELLKGLLGSNRSSSTELAKVRPDYLLPQHVQGSRCRANSICLPAPRSA